MDLSSVESSLLKYLYDNFEALLGIKVFESVYYVDFETYNKWIVLDPLSNSVGSIPTANFSLHISTKKGLLDERLALNRLCGKVLEKINPGTRIDVYSDTTYQRIGEMEISSTRLLPTLQHAGGGTFRTLSVSIVYAGESPAT